MTQDTETPGRRDGVALWRRIADVVREEIARGTHRAGARLPGETALAARFSVNRHTVRQALQALAEEGLVRAERGRGTIVEPPRLDYPIGRRTRFSEIVSAQAREPRGRLLSSAVVAAPEDVARRLRGEEGEDLVEIETLSLADQHPIGLATHWFRARRFAALPERYAATGSITRALAACGIDDYTRHRTRITARPAAPEEASLLSLPVGAPLLVSEAVNVAPDGTPTHLSRTRFAADRVQIVVGEDG